MDDESSYILKDSYVDKMMDYLQNDSLIPEEFIHLFYSKIMKAVTEKAYDSISDHAKNFCLYMSHVWSSQLYLNATSNPTLIFQLGELHTCAKILDGFFAEKEEENDIEENSKRFINRKSFFEYIDDNPGIKHSDLAAKMNISLSNLSQFASKIKGYKYHIERICGREKYYYLTKTGINLLKRMQARENTKVACVAINPNTIDLKDYISWLYNSLNSFKNNSDSASHISNYMDIYLDRYFNNSLYKSTLKQTLSFKPTFSNQHDSWKEDDTLTITFPKSYFVNFKKLSTSTSLINYTFLMDYCIKENNYSTAFLLAEKLLERIKQIETEKFTLEKKNVDLPNELPSSSTNWINVLIENEPAVPSLPSTTQFTNKKKTLVKDILSSIQDQNETDSVTIHNSSHV